MDTEKSNDWSRLRKTNNSVILQYLRLTSLSLAKVHSTSPQCKAYYRHRTVHIISWYTGMFSVLSTVHIPLHEIVNTRPNKDLKIQCEAFRKIHWQKYQI